MAVLKCKICGGNLELIQGSSLCECEACGTQQTVPTSDDKKILAVFDRANELRNKCLFDEARSKFESVIEEQPEDAEAYWGMFLCDYGIEYVEDPGTGKMIPTCHRSSFECVADNIDYNSAIEYASDESRPMYIKEAKHIEELRNGINVIANKEDPYDIFICYKETDDDGERTEDSVIAQDIYTALEKEGYRVFFSKITLEDHIGEAYEPYIFRALTTAKIMLLVCANARYYNAPWVKNEWKRFLAMKAAQGSDKYLFPCYKNIDPYEMPREIRSLQGQDMGRIGATQDLVRNIEKILGKKKQEPVYENSEQSNAVILHKNKVELGYMALEDGSWNEAEKHFNEALQYNAKSGDAHLGMVIAKARCHNLTSYLKSIEQEHLPSNVEKKQIDITKDSQISELIKHIDDMAERYDIGEKYSRSDIKAEYDYDFKFLSTEDFWRSKEESIIQWRKSPVITRSYNYSDENKKKLIDDTYNGIYGEIRKHINDEQKASNDFLQSKIADFTNFVKRTDYYVYRNYLSFSSEANYENAMNRLTSAINDNESELQAVSNTNAVLNDEFKNSHAKRKKYMKSMPVFLVLTVISVRLSPLVGLFALILNTFTALLICNLRNIRGLKGYGIALMAAWFFTGIQLPIYFAIAGDRGSSFIGCLIVFGIIPAIAYFIEFKQYKTAAEALEASNTKLQTLNNTRNSLLYTQGNVQNGYNGYLNTFNATPNFNQIFSPNDYIQR